MKDLNTQQLRSVSGGASNDNILMRPPVFKFPNLPGFPWVSFPFHGFTPIFPLWPGGDLPVIPYSKK